MADINTAANAASKISGFSSGILDVLSKGLGGGGFNNSMFEEMLSQNVAANVGARLPGNSAVSGQGVTGLPTVSSGVIPAVDMNSWRHLLKQVQDFVATHIKTPASGSTASTNGTPAAQANQSGVPAASGNACAGQTSATASTSAAATTTTSTSTDAASGDSASDSSTVSVKDIQDILAELLQLIQLLMRQQLVPVLAGTNATGADGKPADSKDGASQDQNADESASGQTTTDPLAGIMNALQNVLDIVRKLEQQLTAATGTAQSGDAATSNDNPVTEDDLKKGFAQLLEALKTLSPSKADDTPTSQDDAKVGANGNANDGKVATLGSEPVSTQTAPETSNNDTGTNAGSSNDWQKLFSDHAPAPAPTHDPSHTFVGSAEDKASGDKAALAAANMGFGNNEAITKPLITQMEKNFAETAPVAATGGAASSNPSSSLVFQGIGMSGSYGLANRLSAPNGAALSTGFSNVVDQVILQLNRGAKAGISEMTLQLHPADLGRINVSLSFGQDGGVQGMVVVENQATLDALLKDVRSLERALQDAGLRADPGSLQFSLGGQQNNNSGQTANDTSGRAMPNENLPEETMDVALEAVPQETYILTPGRVNMQV